MTDQLGRRDVIGFFAAGLSLAATGAARSQSLPEAANGPAPDAPDVRARAFSAELVELKPHVYAFIQLPAPGQGGLSLANCGLIAGPNGLTAIDATAAPLQARNFIAKAEAATHAKFRRVIITHQHFDHTLGLQFFGDVDVLAQDNCRGAMAAAATDVPVKRLWGPLRGWSDGRDTFHRVAPNITYETRMSLFDVGPAEVQLIHPGRAHTDGDTIVYLPREKILFAGDLAFFKMTPLNSGGYTHDWIEACDTILAMDIDIIVPGHGPVWYGFQMFRVANGRIVEHWDETQPDAPGAQHRSPLPVTERVRQLHAMEAEQRAAIAARSDGRPQ